MVAADFHLTEGFLYPTVSWIIIKDERGLTAHLSVLKLRILVAGTIPLRCGVSGGRLHGKLLASQSGWPR
jgi:hypothetical protein